MLSTNTALPLPFHSGHFQFHFLVLLLWLQCQRPPDWNRKGGLSGFLPSHVMQTGYSSNHRVACCHLGEPDRVLLGKSEGVSPVGRAEGCSIAGAFYFLVSSWARPRKAATVLRATVVNSPLGWVLRSVQPAISLSCEGPCCLLAASRLPPEAAFFPPFHLTKT